MQALCCCCWPGRNLAICVGGCLLLGLGSGFSIIPKNKSETLNLWCAGRNLAICVGNSQPALVDWFMQQPQTPRVILTDAHMARGVLEGFSRHGLF